MHLNEETVDSKLVYKGKIFEVFSDTALLENGKTTGRDVLRHPGGVCIVALNEKNEIFFVRQFRYPHKKVLLEIPAGKLEWGEEPLECGKRELREETGYTAERFRPLGKLFPTPAYDTEIIYMYLAEGLRRSEQDLDDNEFLDVLTIPLEKAVQMVLDNEIDDAKTQLALLKAAAILR